MERCLGDFDFETMLVYLDHIIFSKTLEDHIKHLDWVLVKNTKSTRSSKMEPKWEHTQYLMMRLSFPPTPVYDCPNPVKRRHHCNMLRYCVLSGDCPNKPTDDWEAFNPVNLPPMQEAPLLNSSCPLSCLSP